MHRVTVTEGDDTPQDCTMRRSAWIAANCDTSPLFRTVGALPSFHLLRIQRPETGLTKYVWDPATSAFLASDWGRYRHSDEGWVAA